MQWNQEFCKGHSDCERHGDQEKEKDKEDKMWKSFTVFIRKY